MINTFYCNYLYYNQRNTIPVKIEDIGIDLFGPDKYINLARAQECTIASSYDPRAFDVIPLLKLNKLAEQYVFLSPNERLGNLFILSILHRLLGTVTYSMRLKLDTMNINPIYKHLAQSALIIAQAVFLVYVVGYPISDFILNSCITQASSFAISFFSIRASNWLRSLDLLSETTEINFHAYAYKTMATISIDALLTIFYRGRDFYHDMTNDDKYHRFFVCGNGKEFELNYIPLPAPLISISDKMVWLLGKLTCDATIFAMHKLRYVQDIRSPIINAFYKSAHDQQAAKIRQELARIKSLKKESSADSEEKGEFSKSDRQLHTISSSRYYGTHSKEKTSITRRRSKASIETLPFPAIKDETKESQDLITTSVKLHDQEFYQIAGGVYPQGIWACIKADRFPSKEIADCFERSLKSGHIGPNAAIKSLDKGVIEVRPKSIDYRAIAMAKRGIESLMSHVPLGEAITICDTLKSGKVEEPKIAVFDKCVRHNKINEEILKIKRENDDKGRER